MKQAIKDLKREIFNKLIKISKGDDENLLSLLFLSSSCLGFEELDCKSALRAYSRLEEDDYIKNLIYMFYPEEEAKYLEYFVNPQIDNEEQAKTGNLKRYVRLLSTIPGDNYRLCHKCLRIHPANYKTECPWCSGVKEAFKNYKNERKIK